MKGMMRKVAVQNKFARKFDLAKEGGLEEALTYLAGEDKNVKYFIEKALLFQRDNDLKGAEAMFKEGLVMQPHHIEASMRLGLMYLSQRRLNEAEPLLQHAAMNAAEGAEKERAKAAYRALGIIQNKAGAASSLNAGKVAEKLEKMDEATETDVHKGLIEKLKEVFVDSQGQRTSYQRDALVEKLDAMKPEVPGENPILLELIDICLVKESCARDAIKLSETLACFTKTAPEADDLESLSANIAERHWQLRGVAAELLAKQNDDACDEVRGDPSLERVRGIWGYIGYIEVRGDPSLERVRGI